MASQSTQEGWIDIPLKPYDPIWRKRPNGIEHPNLAEFRVLYIPSRHSSGVPDIFKCKYIKFARSTSYTYFEIGHNCYLVPTQARTIGANDWTRVLHNGMVQISVVTNKTNWPKDGGPTYHDKKLPGKAEIDKATLGRCMSWFTLNSAGDKSLTNEKVLNDMQEWILSKPYVATKSTDIKQMLVRPPHDMFIIIYASNPNGDIWRAHMWEPLSMSFLFSRWDHMEKAAAEGVPHGYVGKAVWMPKPFPDEAIKSLSKALEEVYLLRGDPVPKTSRYTAELERLVGVFWTLPDKIAVLSEAILSNRYAKPEAALRAFDIEPSPPEMLKHRPICEYLQSGFDKVRAMMCEGLTEPTDDMKHFRPWGDFQSTQVPSAPTIPAVARGPQLETAASAVPTAQAQAAPNLSAIALGKQRDPDRDDPLNPWTPQRQGLPIHRRDPLPFPYEDEEQRRSRSPDLRPRKDDKRR